VAVAPSRSNDQSVGVALGEMSLHESPPVPIKTIDSLASLLAGGVDVERTEPIAIPAITTAAVAVASSWRRVTRARLLGRLSAS
jgi:hypothetical protein